MYGISVGNICYTSVHITYCKRVILYLLFRGPSWFSNGFLGGYVFPLRATDINDSDIYKSKVLKPISQHFTCQFDAL